MDTSFETLFPTISLEEAPDPEQELDPSEYTKFLRRFDQGGSSPPGLSHASFSPNSYSGSDRSGLLFDTNDSRTSNEYFKSALDPNLMNDTTLFAFGDSVNGQVFENAWDHKPQHWPSVAEPFSQHMPFNADPLNYRDECPVAIQAHPTQSGSNLSTDRQNNSKKRRMSSGSSGLNSNGSESSSPPTEAYKAIHREDPSKKSERVSFPKGEKTSHNMIEKKYRTNINDKILELRQAVPALRYAKDVVDDGDFAPEELDGLERARKLNKATILAKATEYIHHLENRLEQYKTSNEQLHSRIQSLQRQSAEYELHANSPSPTNNAYGNASRILMGGLAAATVVNQFGSNEEGQMGALSVIPGSSYLFNNAQGQHFLTWSRAASGAVSGGSSFIKIAFAMGIMLFAVFQGLFSRTPNKRLERSQDCQIQDTTQASVSSPLCVRRKVFESATAGVLLPCNLSSTARLLQKLFHVCARLVVGYEGSRMLSRRSEDDEIVRVRTWTTIINCQLSGADVRVNGVRLFYTFLVGLTLPSSASRLMLSALHIRLLTFGYTSEKVSLTLSRLFWGKARQVKAKTSPYQSILPSHWKAMLENFDVEEIFSRGTISNARSLVNGQSHCKLKLDGFASDPGTGKTVDSSEIKYVEDDQDLHSPIDAVAAWFVRAEIEETVAQAVKCAAQDNVMPDTTRLNRVAKLAPPASAVYREILLCFSVLQSGNYRNALRLSLQTTKTLLPPESMDIKSTLESPCQSCASCAAPCRGDSLDQSTAERAPRVPLAEIYVLRCALLLDLMSRKEIAKGFMYFGEIAACFKRFADVRVGSVRLLRVLSAFKACQAVCQNKRSWSDFDSTVQEHLARSVETLAVDLRMLIGNEDPVNECFGDLSVRHSLIRSCLDMIKQANGFSVSMVHKSISDESLDEDAGYHSGE